MDPSPSLRTRSVLGIYDAAFEASVSSPRLVAISLLGAAPISLLAVLLIYTAAEGIAFPGGMGVLTTLCALATLWRFVTAGAASRLVLDRLSGKEAEAGAAMREALWKAPVLIAAGSTCLWVAVASVPLLLLPVLFAGGAWLAAPLAMEGACAPWRTITTGRRLLGNRAAAAGGLTLLWLTAILVLALNLAVMMNLLLMLARGLLDLELGYLRSLFSASNPAYIPSLAALAFVVLEPVRLSSLALLYADARVRREGMDLRAEAAALSTDSRRSRHVGRAAALLLLLALSFPTIAEALAGPDHAGDLARGRAQISGETEEPALRRNLQELIRRGERLPGAPSRSLDRLARRIEADVDEGRLENARRRLERAKDEIETAAGTAGQGRADARRLAREILDRPEFRRLERPDTRTIERPDRSFWDRFWDWLARHLREREPRARSSTGGPYDMRFLDVLWGIALVLFVAIVIVLVVRALGTRHPREADEEPEEPGDSPATGSRLGLLGIDPLSRSPEAWLEEADRLSSAGAHREALRAAYLALLARLHRSRAIDYSPSRSNWEHALAYRGSEEGRVLMCDLTRRFDRAWYGQRETGVDEYQRARRAALSLFRAEPPRDMTGGTVG